MATTGGSIMAQMLKAEGVDTIFGIIDGTYTQFFWNAVHSGIKLITPRHETIAAHMAGAYARLTGKLGVCMASNGPGVANMLSGVAVEQGEGNRVLLITSSRRSAITYPDRGGAYQCFDQVGVIRPMAKWSETADSAGRVPELMRQALRKCWEGRPGVVHLDVPENVINGEAKPVGIQKPEQYRPTQPLAPRQDQVEEAAQMLTKARLPIIHCGSGVIHAAAYDELAQLAEVLHAPVCTSWSARGVLPETNPLAWNMVHIKAVNQLRNEADLVLVLGSELGETDWWGKAPYWATPDRQKLIQVDIDAQRLGRNRPADLIVQADAKEFLTQLLERVQGRTGEMPIEGRKSKVASLAKERDQDRASLDEKLSDTSEPMVTAHVAKICREVFDDDAVIVFDGGNTAVWGNFYHEMRVPNTQLGTHHFGHLGAGTGQALGACAARPDKQVYCITGDGAMGFHPQEIETAVRNNLKPIFLVCADKQWGMVKINQIFALKPVQSLLKKAVLKRDLGQEETINTELGEIAWDKLAESMGAHGERVSAPDQLKPALERALESGRCAVIHIDVDPEKHMFAPGLMHFKAMHQEPKGK
jgi:acetolactate synthase-1/2/3 large subunit